MRKITLLAVVALQTVWGQDTLQQQKTSTLNPFRKMTQEFATPNSYRTAAGAPGAAYYQQQADYVMQIELDDDHQKIYGNQTITYTNNSPDKLEYLWVQLDQNVRAPHFPANLRKDKWISPAYTPEEFVKKHLEPHFEGGFQIDYVKDAHGKEMDYTINQTMMRIDLPKPMLPNEKLVFSIKWSYLINDYQKNGGRSGYEYFPEEDNRLYVIAQFFPRMAVYNDTEGWQNEQFWGDGEFALPFGNYEVAITVPADHIVEATGELQNRKAVFSPLMLQRYNQAQKDFDKPTFIVTEQEARINEKTKSKDRKTWRFKAQNVRDFAFSSSRKFIYEMMPVKINSRLVMAVSLYPKEGSALWGKFATKVIAHTLKTYSQYTLDYPYPKAVAVNAEDQGMEYPMISWNHGRSPNGTFSDEVKFGMMSVIIHEVGHNFFPMIVNSDERQWAWMDEGINTFLQFLTEQSYGKTYPKDIYPYEKFPSERGFPHQIIPYMSANSSEIAPIMSNPETVQYLGENAYSKPATGLNILRETIMGHKLFDHAFKTYVNRWKFKHPTPEDFFRTMEDASGVALDWFWRTWFYTTDYVDLGIKSVKIHQVSELPSDEVTKILEDRGVKLTDLRPLVHLVSESDKAYDVKRHQKSVIEISDALSDYIADNLPLQQQAQLSQASYFYEITFEKKGGVPMPIILQVTYADGTSEVITYPVQVWRKNNLEFVHVLATTQPITHFQIDPEQVTADIHTENNHYPQNK
ncbi:M1 family metallopeptidase [Capnocytophaga canimorsus]|uniref:M1 family metallopeptidase n=1 Tax=Capnocytophaga canimorsus TaxID=28188 RepID=UPI00385A3CE4